MEKHTCSLYLVHITMAQAGKRVLLIDADLRIPTQHTNFGIRNDSGLATIQTGKDTLDQAIQPSAVSGLGSPLPADPSLHTPPGDPQQLRCSMSCWKCWPSGSTR